jgi:hypothetical protein
MKEKSKVVGGLIIAATAVTAGLSGVLVGGKMFPQTEEILKEVVKMQPCPEVAPKIVEKEVIVTKEVEKLVEVEKIVEVDNANLGKAISFIQDEVDEDIDMDYILFEVDAKIEAETYISENIVKLLDGEDLFDKGELLGDYRKSEISVRKIADSEVLYRHFDRKDLELKYEVTVRAQKSGEKSEYFDFEITIPFEKGNLIKEDIIVE